MLNAFRNIVFRLIFGGKEADTMLAMLWAQRIINEKKTYADVPRLLKEQVKEILVESGMEHLVTE